MWKSLSLDFKRSQGLEGRKVTQNWPTSMQVVLVVTLFVETNPLILGDSGITLYWNDSCALFPVLVGRDHGYSLSATSTVISLSMYPVDNIWITKAFRWILLILAAWYIWRLWKIVEWESFCILISLHSFNKIYGATTSCQGSKLRL